MSPGITKHDGKIWSITLNSDRQGSQFLQSMEAFQMWNIVCCAWRTLFFLPSPSTTNAAKRGRRHSITRQPSSRAADEGATICQSCQHWGELGICQPPPLSFIHANPDSRPHKHSRPSLYPHSVLDTRAQGETGGNICGLFHPHFWPQWTKLCYAD